MAMDPSTPDQAVIDLDKEAASVESDVVAAEQTADEQDKLAKTQDRSMIAKWIVRGFVIIIGLFLLCVVLGVVGDYVWPDKMAKWRDGAALIKDVLSSILLPVVTLVIGFYFGVEKKP